jgi:RHS repeat-associated protein
MRGLRPFAGVPRDPAPTASCGYDAFGNVVSSTGAWQGPFGYGGPFGCQEDATGLRLLGPRLYDPSTGRFLTRDPVKDGRNWYVYCAGDPVNFTDPTGLCWESAFDFAMLVKGIADFIEEPSLGTGVGVIADGLALIAPVPNIAAVRHLRIDEARALPRRQHFPEDPGQIDDKLGVPGRPRPDGPDTPGRGKIEWPLPNGRTLVFERHPSKPIGDPRHDDWHYHVNPPGGRPHCRDSAGQQAWRPGEAIPWELIL